MPRTEAKEALSAARDALAGGHVNVAVAQALIACAVELHGIAGDVREIKRQALRGR